MTSLKREHREEKWVGDTLGALCWLKGSTFICMSKSNKTVTYFHFYFYSCWPTASTWTRVNMSCTSNISVWCRILILSSNLKVISFNNLIINCLCLYVCCMYVLLILCGAWTECKFHGCILLLHIYLCFLCIICAVTGTKSLWIMPQKYRNIANIKLDFLNMLVISHCQKTTDRDWRLWAGRQTDRQKMCLALMEDTGSYHSIICRFFDLLTIVHLVSSFLSLLPALLPSLLFLSLSPSLLPFSACAELWSHSSDESKMYYSVAPLHRHTRAHRKTDTVYTRACVFSYVCVAVGPLTEWDKLSVSHFSEWISILACFCFFMCGYAYMCECVCIFVRLCYNGPHSHSSDHSGMSP